MQEYPYNDEHLVFNELTARYELTTQAILDYFGIDLEAAAKGSANGDTAVSAILKLVSNQVYNFIHNHNTNNRMQDFLISATETGRDIIKRAMLEQFMYIRTVGDLSRSTDPNKRDMWFDKQAESVLYENIIYNGHTYCLLYTGRYPVLI